MVSDIGTDVPLSIRIWDSRKTARRHHRHQGAEKACLFCDKAAWYQTVVGKRLVKIGNIIVKNFQEVVAGAWADLNRYTQGAGYVYCKMALVELLVVEASSIGTQVFVEL